MSYSSQGYFNPGAEAKVQNFAMYIIVSALAED